ncbi:MAG: 3-hydroxyacyl-ACP dehydratase FabZ [Halanaerobiaceae bacterium]
MDINEIKAMLPHRYPFLLVDRIIDLKPEEKVVGIKNVTINEEFFQGHFPDHPIMPGVLIVEAMAQVSGFLMYHSVENPEDKLPYFTGIDRAKFRRPVVPGDTLRIEGEVIRLRGTIAKIAAKGYVEEDLAAEAELMFALQDKE